MKTIMKKIVIFLSVAALSVAAASCSNLNTEPSFDDRNAFVEFDKGSKVVKEDDGEISIPVTLCSLKGIEDAVSFEVKDGKAKAGTDFELVDGTAVLNFDSSNRTRNIKIKVIEHKGEYTGDLDFTIALKSAGTAGIGMVKKCKVTIQDNDHPLANILGAYSASATAYSGSPVTWNCNLTKDADDPTLVYWDAAIPFCEGYKGFEFIGTVNEEKNQITFVAGQKCRQYDETPDDFFALYGWYEEDGGIYLSEDDIVFTLEDGEWVYKSGILLLPVITENLYSNTLIYGPVTLTKK